MKQVPRLRPNGALGGRLVLDHSDCFRGERLGSAVSEEGRVEWQAHRLRNDGEQGRVGEILYAGVLATSSRQHAREAQRLTELEAQRASACKDIGNSVRLV